MIILFAVNVVKILNGKLRRVITKFVKILTILPTLATTTKQPQYKVIFNERKLVLELLISVKVRVKVTMKKFRNSFLLPELVDDFLYS